MRISDFSDDALIIRADDSADSFATTCSGAAMSDFSFGESERVLLASDKVPAALGVDGRSVTSIKVGLLQLRWTFVGGSTKDLEITVRFDGFALTTNLLCKLLLRDCSKVHSSGMTVAA